jgi:hypothetical protein
MEAGSEGVSVYVWRRPPPARNVGGFKGCTYNYFEF